MSAVLVTNETVNRIAAYAAAHRLAGVDPETASSVALMLWQENRRNLDWIYGVRSDRWWPSAQELEEGFVFDQSLVNDPEWVGTVVDAYVYQSCDAKTWAASRACAITRDLHDHCFSTSMAT